MATYQQESEKPCIKNYCKHIFINKYSNQIWKTGCFRNLVFFNFDIFTIPTILASSLKSWINALVTPPNSNIFQCCGSKLTYSLGQTKLTNTLQKQQLELSKETKLPRRTLSFFLTGSDRIPPMGFNTKGILKKIICHLSPRACLSYSFLCATVFSWRL